MSELRVCNQIPHIQKGKTPSLMRGPREGRFDAQKDKKK